MISNRDVKKQLLLLNIMAEPTDTNYNIQYEYKYNPMLKRMKCRTMITKWCKGSKVNTIQIVGGCVYVLRYIGEEMQLYVGKNK